jgi:hypothetical protein
MKRNYRFYTAARENLLLSAQLLILQAPKLEIEWIT